MIAPRLGILDWGIGGMGVVRLLRQQAPQVPLLYVSDSGFTPYGKVPRAALAARVTRVVESLHAQGATGVLVACNAASTVVGDVVQRVRPFPLLGVIEPALGLVPRSFRGVLGVIGGARTIRSGMYRRGLSRRGVRVVSRVAQPLSAHIEAGTAGSEACGLALDRILAPLRDADAILLACTHYPAILEDIQARAPGATLLDPAEALVSRALAAPWLAGEGTGKSVFATTGDPRAMRASTRRAWGFDPGPCRRWDIA